MNLFYIFMSSFNRSFGSSKEIKFILTSTSAVFIASSMFGSIAYSKDALEFFQKYINKYKTFYEFKVIIIMYRDENLKLWFLHILKCVTIFTLKRT